MKISSLLFLAGLLLAILSGVNAETSCGNHSCETGENSCTCTQDCGSCESFSTEAFTYRCVENVCRQYPNTGVCGNNQCEASVGENYGSCSLDCEPTELTIEIASPLPNQVFALGGNGSIQLKITANGKSIRGVKVTAVKPFKAIEVENIPFSDDYSAEFQIPNTTTEGTHEIQFTASYHSLTNKTTLPVLVKADLNAEIQSPDQISLGDTLLINGKIQNGTRPVQTSLELLVLDSNQNRLNAQTIQTDENGTYRAEFKTSLLDPEGEWIIRISGSDQNHNRIQSEKKIAAERPGKPKSLRILASTPDLNKAIRGEDITIFVQVFDQTNQIFDANVELTDFLGNTFPFNPQADGNFALLYHIADTSPLGEREFTIKASQRGQRTLTGQQTVAMTILASPLTIQILEPAPRVFAIGDTINFRVFIQYASKEPVLDANVLALLKKYEIQLQPQGAGYYIGSYQIQEFDIGEEPFKISATDNHNQTAEQTQKINVFGYGIAFYWTRYGLPLMALLAIAFVAYRIGQQKVKKKQDKTKAQKRKTQLLEMETDLQKQYFEKGGLTKTEYENRMQELEEELKTTNQQPGEKK